MYYGAITQTLKNDKLSRQHEGLGHDIRFGACC